MKAWIYGGKATGVSLRDILNTIWKEEQIPKEWKTNIIVPLHKKGNTEKVENYRGIALLCSAYKIYTEILRNRLESDVDKLKLLPARQDPGKENLLSTTYLF